MSDLLPYVVGFLVIAVGCRYGQRVINRHDPYRDPERLREHRRREAEAAKYLMDQRHAEQDRHEALLRASIQRDFRRIIGESDDLEGSAPEVDVEPGDKRQVAQGDQTA